MTTALSRAVSSASYSRLKASLLAAASTSLLVTFSSPASAASCSTDATNNICVIDLTSNTDSHDGQAGTDTLNFTNLGAQSYAASAFKSDNTGQFKNFETAILTNTALVISDGDADGVSNINWTIDGTSSLILNLTSSAVTNDTIGDGSAVTVNAGGNLILWESERIGALSGAGNVVMWGGTLSVAAANNTFSGNIGNVGNLALVAGGSNKWILNSNNSYTGTTTVTSGTLEIQHAGAIDNSSSVTINGGQITSKVVANYDLNSLTITSGRLTGNATIHGNVSSNGGLQPGNTNLTPGSLTDENPGQDMGTIHITGHYTATGSNAYVGSFINIDAAAPAGGTPGVTHDFFNIDGDYTGTQRTLFSHLTFLSNPTGFATTGNGIQVIRIGGANSGNDFYQSLAITAGPYQYLLKYVPNYSGTDDGYFLQSATRDELLVQPFLVSAGQSLVRNCYHDGQRVPDSPKGATYGRAWIGYRQGSTDFGADTGVEGNVDFNCTTGGMDWRMGHGWFGGVSGGFGDTEGSILTPAGTGTYTGTGRMAEAFASFTSSSLFINLSAGYNAMEYTYDGKLMSLRLAETAGFLASAQTGVALDLDAIAVKLFGSVSYDGTNCSDGCLGLATDAQESGLIEAKGTIRFDGVANGGSIRPWVQASFSDVLSDGINSATKGGVTVTHDANGQLLNIDAGLQGYLDQNFALYIDGGYQESLSKDVSGYKAGVGLKMYW